MAYNVVPTVANGDSWSAAQHNTYLKDNLAALWPYTSAGDMSYAATSTTLARLGIGANGSILRSNGSIPSWLPGGAAGTLLYNSAANTPAWLAKGTAYKLLRINSGGTNVEWADVGKAIGGKAQRSTTQSIPDNTDTVITFDTEIFDSGTVWVSGSPTRLTVPITGVYLIVGSVAWTTNNNNARRVFGRLNGTTTLIYDSRAAAPNISTQQTFNFVIPLDAGNYVEMLVWQNSGGALNTLAVEPKLSINLLGML